MAEPHEVLAKLSPDEAAQALRRCCGSERWVVGMLERLPFDSTAALFAAADAVWARLGSEDHLEAFSHHPRIGADLPSGGPVDPSDLESARLRATAAWARAEQAGAVAADPETRQELRAGNLAYTERFGFAFIVCATGKSAAEMVALLHERLHNAPETERLVAAREQARITHLRLEKLAT
jgi:2-oxo-4-hydroxy-4-carboxy-5-ureidoimidazoline decarboxylase